MPTVRLIPVIPGFYRFFIGPASEISLHYILWSSWSLRSDSSAHHCVTLLMIFRRLQSGINFSWNRRNLFAVSDFQIPAYDISYGFPDVSMFPRRHLHLQPADFHWLLTFVRLSDSFYSIFCIICGIYADIIYKMHIFKHAEDFFRNNQKKTVANYMCIQYNTY